MARENFAEEAIGRAAQQAVEDSRPHLVVSITASLSPVVKYHGLARRHLTTPGFLMRPQLNSGTLGGPRCGWRLATT
jgi:ornithine cyclodeaminase/alanine dehydrogenase-like protein (mu-crystallin family)